MKILILTTNTGGGHNAAAGAIKEEADLRGISCDIVNFMDFVPEYKARFVVEGHSLTYRYTPKMYGMGYHFAEDMKDTGKMLYREYAKYAKPLRDYICAGAYDTVIAVHIFAGLMLTKIRKDQNLNIRQYLVITDYTCSPGAPECEMDAWFIPAGMRPVFEEKGIPADRILETGIPCSRKFYEPLSQKEARNRLDLQEDGSLVFLCANTMAVSRFSKLVRLLLESRDDWQIYALWTGQIKNEEKHIILTHPRLHLMSHTGQMALWMKAADVLITKAGGLTVTEAVSSGVPLVLMNAVPGLESRNRNLMAENGCALSAKKAEEIAECAERLMSDPVLRDSMLKNQKLRFSEIAVEKLMDAIV